MPFECKKYHSECKARCCGIVPIPVHIWQRNQHNIQKDVKEKLKCYITDPEKIRHKAIIPVTNDGLCPFLKEDLSCAIYNDRPTVCKKFGDETHWALKCPMQKVDGTPRTDEEKKELDQEIEKNIQCRSSVV